MSSRLMSFLPFFLLASIPRSIRASAFQTGDLAFLRPAMNATSAFDQAVLATGEATLQWMLAQGLTVTSNFTADHVALALRNGSGLFFVEAVCAPRTRTSITISISRTIFSAQATLSPNLQPPSIGLAGGAHHDRGRLF
jgi:hypothetical protein